MENKKMLYGGVGGMGEALRFAAPRRGSRVIKDLSKFADSET